jgi:hypothetical protein
VLRDDEAVDAVAEFAGKAEEGGVELVAGGAWCVSYLVREGGNGRRTCRAWARAEQECCCGGYLLSC